MKRLNTIKKELEALGFSIYEHEGFLTLSTEQGNLDAFEYVNFDYPIDLIPTLRILAKNAGYEWQCEYTGTYRLYPL